MTRTHFNKAGFFLTKNAMARAIIQVLHNLDTLPAADDVRVTRKARAHKYQELVRGYELVVGRLAPWGK